jgi:peroxiredoxin
MKTNILTLMACLVIGTATTLTALETGKPAPEFTLTDTNGKSHKLSDFKGKTVVLEWVNHGCPFVVKHYGSGNMQKLQKIYTEKGVVWLSVCSSAPGKQGNMTAVEWNRTTVDKIAFPTSILLDEDGKVGQLYGAQTTPQMYVINAQGLLVYEGAIDSIKSTDAADIPKAENYVAKALDEVLAGKAVSTPSTKSYGCSVKYAK